MIEVIRKDYVEMHFDIVSTLRKYQGMGRILEPLEGLNKNNKKYCQEMFDLYLSYVDLELEYAGKVEDKKAANGWIALCADLKKYEVPCELIVYDDKPLNNAFGYDVEFLGIDIVHDMCESLIENQVNPKICHLLNENGLCRNKEDVEKIIPFQDHGDVEWEPCYIYRLIY